jgi:hypothetical protein
MLPLLSFGVERKKQRKTLTNRMAPPDLSGYTLLTWFATKLRGAGFYGKLEGVDQLLCYRHHCRSTYRSQNIKKAPLYAGHQVAIGQAKGTALYNLANP